MKVVYQKWKEYKKEKNIVGQTINLFVYLIIIFIQQKYNL